MAKPARHYIGRLSPWNRQKPRFVATVTASLDPILATQQLLDQIVPAFDLDTAVGAQLDINGLLVGEDREIAVPISGIYFELDSASLGLDQANWKGPFDPDSGIVRADDSLFRKLIRAKIYSNHWDGTMEDINPAFAALFSDNPGTRVFVRDNQNMTMDVCISGALPSLIYQELLKAGYSGVKPATVRLTYYLTSVDGMPIFGFDANNQYLGGLDQSAWAIRIEQQGSDPGAGPLFGFDLNTARVRGWDLGFLSA